MKRPRAKAILLAMGLAACSPKPLGLRTVGDSGASPASDASSASLSDTARTPTDDAITMRDSDTASTPPACAALKPLADQGLLLAARTNEAHFTKDRSRLVLRVRADPSAGLFAPDRLLRVDLPSGKVTTITNALTYAETLGTDGDLLVHNDVAGADDISVYDGQTLRHLATGLCSTLPSPDGRQVYVVARCEGGDSGNLEVLDVAVGGSGLLAKDVVSGSVVTSPSGRFIAFLTLGASRADDTNRVGVIETASGASYTLDSRPGSRDPFFVSDELLIFTTGAYAAPARADSEIRGHLVGTGDTSYVIETGHDPGFSGYQLSYDGSHILTAATEDDGLSASLYSTSLDGREHRLLALDLYPFWFAPITPMRPFAYDTQRPRAIYQSLGSPFGVTVMLSESGLPMKISENATFQPAPASTSVVLFEMTADGRSRLRLYGIDWGADRLSYVSDMPIRMAKPVRGDQALVFVESMASGASRLRFLSPSHPDTVLLGEWDETRIAPQSAPEANPRGYYPVDPTDCFTVVDTDLPPGPGTRLVLLPD